MAILLITGILGIVWFGAMLGRRKKILLCISAGLYLIPTAYAAVLTYFPEPREFWLQVIAAGMYVKEHVIQKAEEAWNAWSTGNKNKRSIETETMQKEQKKEELKNQEQEASIENRQTEQDIIPQDTEKFSYGSMKELWELGSFAPREGVLFTVIQEEMPTDTVYVPKQYGKEYDGGSWSAGSATDPIQEFLQYPPSLERLQELCEEASADSLKEAEQFVEETLSSEAVYDANPGSTPPDQDFAEYFLFENHRGFCVHFATTATVMYPILEIPARFVEGYAIPASAFSQ